MVIAMVLYDRGTKICGENPHAIKTIFEPQPIDGPAVQGEYR